MILIVFVLAANVSEFPNTPLKKHKNPCDKFITQNNLD